MKLYSLILSVCQGVGEGKSIKVTYQKIKMLDSKARVNQKLLQPRIKFAMQGLPSTLLNALLQNTSPTCTLIDKTTKGHIASSSPIFPLTATIIIRYKCINGIRINLTQTQGIKHI